MEIFIIFFSHVSDCKPPKPFLKKNKNKKSCTRKACWGEREGGREGGRAG
jgi:hypothetical protein